jgi:hypothetical protein
VNFSVFLLLLCFTPALLPAQTVLSADGKTDTYSLIEKAFGKKAYETPDCGHKAFGPHITQLLDQDLNKYVFVFHLHVKPDDDRCEKDDRQRCEIKTYNPSPDALKGFPGDTCTYHWKFKLDAGFQASPKFCHIHQLKAVDGDDGKPLITITPRGGKSQRLQLIFTPPEGQGDWTVLADADLALFKGVWVEAEEKVTYGKHGSYSLTLRRVKDGAVLLTFTKADLALWREGASFVRPKWGLYRSLDEPAYLRDEEVRFADFSVGKAVH